MPSLSNTNETRCPNAWAIPLTCQTMTDHHLPRHWQINPVHRSTTASTPVYTNPEPPSTPNRFCMLLEDHRRPRSLETSWPTSVLAVAYRPWKPPPTGLLEFPTALEMQPTLSRLLLYIAPEMPDP
jgi:hypothetical protein